MTDYLDQLKDLVAKGEKCTTEGEWFASDHLGNAGLCQVDDGLEYGMYQIVCEWHEGRFIAAAANARPALKALLDRLERYEGLLDELEDYFDQRQDADCDQDGYVPNEEMRMLQLIIQERGK